MRWQGRFAEAVEAMAGRPTEEGSRLLRCSEIRIETLHSFYSRWEVRTKSGWGCIMSVSEIPV